MKCQSIVCVAMLASLGAIAFTQSVAAQGGMSPGGMMGGMMAVPIEPKVVNIVERLGDDAPTHVEASEVFSFLYRVGSLKPELLPRPEGYGMEGGYGGGEGSMMGGYGMGMGGGGEGSDYGGGMMGGYGGPLDGTATKPQTPLLTILAYVIPQEQGRSQLELAVDINDVYSPRRMRGGMGPGLGLGMPGGLEADSGYAAEGGEMGASSGNAFIPVRFRFEALAKTGDGDDSRRKLVLPHEEVTIVAAVIRHSLWKREIIDDLEASKRDAERVAALESELKRLLTDEYETQLSRQDLEIARIEARTAQLREELSRRRAARERIVEVELGRIVLESLGLLGK